VVLDQDPVLTPDGEAVKITWDELGNTYDRACPAKASQFLALTPRQASPRRRWHRPIGVKRARPPRAETPRDACRSASRSPRPRPGQAGDRSSFLVGCEPGLRVARGGAGDLFAGATD
jgi:hypothetical protein